MSLYFVWKICKGATGYCSFDRTKFRLDNGGNKIVYLCMFNRVLHLSLPLRLPGGIHATDRATIWKKPMSMTHMGWICRQASTNLSGDTIWVFKSVTMDYSSLRQSWVPLWNTTLAHQTQPNLSVCRQGIRYHFPPMCCYIYDWKHGGHGLMDCVMDLVTENQCESQGYILLDYFQFAMLSYLSKTKTATSYFVLFTFGNSKYIYVREIFMLLNPTIWSECAYSVLYTPSGSWSNV